MSTGFSLHHTQVTHTGAHPERWLLVLHGIYGSGGNWRTFARKLVSMRPDWGALLVDLRMHGRSQGAPPPHDVHAAAGDVLALARSSEAQGRPVRAILGHSFGGKVALAFRARAQPELAQTWVIDSSPSARPDAMDRPDNTVAQVLTMLRALPEHFASREAFVGAVTEHGFAAIAQWLAMNLERVDGGYRSRLDLAAVGSLLADYYRRDLWSSLTSGPGSVHCVVAGRSSSLSADDRERLHTWPSGAVAVRTTVFPESGHWVHIEALPALLALVSETLPGHELPGRRPNGKTAP